MATIAGFGLVTAIASLLYSFANGLSVSDAMGRMILSGGLGAVVGFCVTGSKRN